MTIGATHQHRRFSRLAITALHARERPIGFALVGPEVADQLRSCATGELV
jgi:hypothetical protein